MNAAICSRGTGSDGLSVVDEVPLVSAEKYASAIEQKKTLLAGTSVNGNEIEEPSQVPVSAVSKREVTTNTNTVATRRSKRLLSFRLRFILVFFPGIGIISRIERCRWC